MQLSDRLGRELQEMHGLTHCEYQIMVRLSEVPGERMRMSELAELTLLSRSRLSHQIDRMERAGLVRRENCEEDRRGAYAALTAAGREQLERAAPDHVDSVRRHFIEQMTSREFESLGQACEKVAIHLDGGDEIGGRAGL